MKKKPKKKRRVGRPSKKDELNFDIARKLAEYGHTMEEIADIVGVDRSNLYEWMKDKNFRDAIKKGREIADERVENAMYHRALGYSHQEEKIFQYEGQIIRAQTVKHYPPDPTSMIFWLKNRKPDVWKDRVPAGAGKDDDLVEQELEFQGIPKKTNGRFKRFYN